MEQPAKKQKTEEEPAAKVEGEAKEEVKEEEVKQEVPKAPEPPKELEVDAKKAKDPRTKEAPVFLVPDTTLNVIQSTNNNVLMCLAEGGIQHFMAGARANVGISKGRYSFEVKVLQVVNTSEGAMHPQNRSVVPRSVLRVGLSTAGSELVLGEGVENIAFESEGSFLHNRVRTPGVQTFGRGGDVLTVLLNLDKDSANFNTVSLFKDGVRAGQPVPLPESLKGKTLFPHVSFKGLSVHANFGLEPFVPLPFTCRMLRDASEADVVVAKDKAAPADGKYSVVFPVALPDEGTFDWLDMWLEKNPQYTELSDRKVLDWAEKSGLTRTRGYAARASNDKPEMGFGVPELDNLSIQRAVRNIAPLQSRHYVVMEVKANLIKEDRAELLNAFNQPHFKRMAYVVVGDPNSEFKRRATSMVLKDKQEVSDKAFMQQQLEAQRKKEIEKRQKEMIKNRKGIEKAVRKTQREAKKKAEEAKAKAAAEKEGEEKKEDAEEAKEEVKKEEEEKVVDSESEKSEEEKEEAAEPPAEKPKVELTAEEKKIVFRKTAAKDLLEFQLSQYFTKFSLPEKAEGFDEIKYEWTKTGSKSKEHVTQWILDKKLTTRVENIQPSAWFETRWKDWQGSFQGWLSKLSEHKAVVTKRTTEKVVRQGKLKAAKEAAAKKAAAGEEKKAEGEEKKAEGEENKAEGEEQKEAAEQQPQAMEVDEEEELEKLTQVEAAAETAFEEADIFGADDILDVGSSVPLFRDFQTEDWTMAALRFELHLLAHGVRRDIDDEERPGIHVDHLAWYYQRYYKRPLNAKDYGVESFKELVELVDDTLFLTPKGILEPVLEGEPETPAIFVKLAEEARRFRAIRLDLGEEGAKLNLINTQQWQGQKPKWQQREHHQGKGGKQWQMAPKAGMQIPMMAPQQFQGAAQFQQGGKPFGKGSNFKGAGQYPGGKGGAMAPPQGVGQVTVGQVTAAGGQDQAAGQNQGQGAGQWQGGQAQGNALQGANQQQNANQFQGSYQQSGNQYQNNTKGSWQGGNQNQGGNQWQSNDKGSYKGGNQSGGNTKGSWQGGNQYQGGGGGGGYQAGGNQQQGGNQYQGGNNSGNQASWAGGNRSQPYGQNQGKGDGGWQAQGGYNKPRW